MMKRSFGMVTLAASLALTAGCTKKAEGQVAAVVNGEEITVQEVNAEMGLQQIPPGVEKDAVRQGALQRIVERRLLAQAAKDDGLDKSPEYLIRRRALDDALLVQTLAKKISATIKVPEARQIDAFITERPAMFANRSILTIDRLQFAPKSNTSLLKQLETAHTLDAVADTLRTNKIEFMRDKGEIDTARLSADAAKQILALPQGEPFILPQGGLYVAGVVVSTRAAPLGGGQVRPVAVNILRGEQLNKAVESRLTAAKQAAKIEYQTGFAPPKGGAAKPAAGPR